jgi:dolichol-phosphate mannosyltransferase/undecaprenyl-phosphate 4-deoxy-4-formamido-L-arabinose transferase
LCSAISAIPFLGGMTLFSLGIIGEYLIRIMPYIERKPTYIIKEKYGIE